MIRKKNAMPLAYLFAFVFVLIISCEKDDGTATSNNSGVSFTASVAGASWKADSVWGYLLHDTAHNFKTLTITGYGGGIKLTVTIRDSSHAVVDSAVSLRTYAVSTSNWLTGASFAYASTPVSIGSSDTVWSKYGTGYNGETVVTADDASAKKVSGNFHFDARTIILDSLRLKTDTVKVTNGDFKNIPYQYGKL